jgi:hypothetical protein
MPTLQEILQDQNYINANPATKKAIFDRWSALDTNYTGANQATQQAIRSRFGVGGIEAAPPAEPPKDKGFFSNVGSLLVEGGKRAIGSAQVSPSVIAGDVSEDKAKLLSEQLSMKPSVQPKELVEAQTAFKDEAEAFEKAEGFTESIGPVAGFLLEFGKQVITNPKGAVYLTAQSAANMAPQIAGMIAGGKGAALAASPAGPQVAALAGAAGAVGGGFAAGVPLEIGSEFIGRIGEKLAERGLEPTEENIAALLRDKAVVEQAISEARTKGVTTAAVDSLMTVGAGKFATGARRSAIDAARKELGDVADAAQIAKRADELLKARTLTQKAGRGAGAVGIETAGGGISEAAGQAAAYGKVDLEDVGAEMLGELGGSAASVPAAAYSTTQDMLKSKAKTDAAKILADEEQARLDAEAAEKAKIPPLALGAEGVFTPVALPDGSVAMTREELAQYEEQQFQKKYAAQEADKKEQEVLALSDQGVFKATPLPDGSVAMTREDLEAYEEQQFRKKYEPVKVEQPPAPEPYVKPASISGTKPDTLLGERADPLAGAVTARREAAAPKAEIPLTDDYAFLQRERQRLLQQDQTPDTKKLLGRIDEQLGTILKRDIERQRADAEAAKTSVFSEKELPPVESRDVVVGNLELGKLQAPERLPDQPITSREIKSAEKMRTAPPPVDDAQARLEQAEMDRRKFMRSKEAKQGNLMEYLKGKLALDEVSDIAPKGKGFEKLANEKGTYISELVSDGMLDEFLPPDQRAGQANFDAQTAAETIKENLRNKNLRPFELQTQIRQLDESVAAAEREAKEPSTVQFDLSEVEPGEAASVERAAGDQAVGAVTDIRYQRSTTSGKSIGKQQTQSVVDAVKSQWSNAPEVVVAESMDDTAIPEAVRAHNKEAIAKGAKGSPKGFFYKGKAYILADSMTSANDAVETLFHESLGHYGLRGTFGPEMSKVLADVVKNRKADVEAKARQYGLDVNSKEDMLEAAEEVLAEMAQTKPGLSFVKRAIAVIRNFLRDLGLPFKMSNEDIIQKYILPARAFVEKGERRAAEGKPAAMREPAKAPPTDSAAFKKWFGDSKVVDENGEPMVVYHGTLKEFTQFEASKQDKRDAGFWFGDAKNANVYAASGEPRGNNVMPVYLSIKNPKVYYNRDVKITPELIEKLKAEGYDGVMRDFANGPDAWRYGEDAAPEWAAFEPGQVKSATGNKGTYDPTNPDIRYQREATQEAEAEPTKSKPARQNIFGEPVLGTWSITVDPKMELQDGLIYKMLDKNIDVKRIVEAVKSTGKQIASQWNPYLQEELYHGRTANASQEFQDKEWLPLLQDMDKKGVTVGELEKYLLNRHAEEYNKLVAYRNPDRPEMQDGGSSVKTEDARKYLASLDKDTKAKYEALAKRVDGITKGTRQLLADEGYEKASTIKNWEESFPNYVPLMREEADFDYNFSSFGTGRGFDVRRDFSRRAMGSKRNVVDILGNVISARNQAISLTEKNRVAQAVYGLALEAPNPDFWMAINPDLAEVREVDRIKQKIAKFMAKKSDPNITDEELDGVKSSLASEYKKLKFAQTKAAEAIEKVRKELVDLGIPEETISAVMQEPEQRILDEKSGRVVKRVNTKLRENDHVLATRINGEKRYVFFNPKDPRSKRAATALKNLDAQDLGTALGMVAKITRWMASVNTQYNPIFGPYNFLRDIQAGALQLSTTELAGQQKEIAKLVIPSMGAIYSSLRKRRKGETVDSDMAKLWKEFQSEGGQTGFRDNFSRTQDRTEALLTEMEKLTEGKLKAGGRAVFDWLSDYNDSLENAVRLSAYKVAKDKFKKEGVSDAEAKQRAASLAKNLTVNFNRKGDVATQMGALYAFFNASMQGSARMIETLKGPMGKKIMGGGLLLGSMQALLLASAGFDDEEPPEFIRSKNIVIPTGDGKYIAFPMPLGFHVIPGISRILTEWTLSGFDDTARRVTDLTGLFLDAFNPIGNAGWSVQTITPTILDPFVALGENKDWTGKPISKEDIFSLRPTPGYTRAREGANWLSTKLAEFLNYASGGDADRKGVLSPTPEQIEYLVGQVFGGVGREAIKLATTVEKTASGEELPPYKIPLYGRFVGETKSSAAESNKFYKNMMKLNELQAVVDGRKDRKEPLGKFFQENPEARMLPMANKTYKDVQALRKRRKALVERDAPKESVQAVEKMITRKMQVLNDRVRALEERN